MHGQVGGSEPTSHGIRLFLGQRSQQTVRSRGQNHPARCQKAFSSWLNMLTVKLFRRTCTSRTIPAQQSAACGALAAPPWCCEALGCYLHAPHGLLGEQPPQAREQKLLLQSRNAHKEAVGGIWSRCTSLTPPHLGHTTVKGLLAATAETSILCLALRHPNILYRAARTQEVGGQDSPISPHFSAGSTIKSKPQDL